MCLHLRQIHMSEGEYHPPLIPESSRILMPTAPEQEATTSADVVDYESLPIAAVEDMYPVLAV